MTGEETSGAHFALLEELGSSLPRAQRALSKRLLDLHVPDSVAETIPPAFDGLRTLLNLWTDWDRDSALSPDIADRISHLTWPIEHLVDQQLVLSDALEYLDQLTNGPVSVTRDLLTADAARDRRLSTSERTAMEAAIALTATAPRVAAEWVAQEEARRRARRRRLAIRTAVWTAVVIPLVLVVLTTTGAPWWTHGSTSAAGTSQSPTATAVSSAAAPSSGGSATPTPSVATSAVVPAPTTAAPTTVPIPTTTAAVTTPPTGPTATIVVVTAGSGVIAFHGGCAPFQVFAQDRWKPYGAAIRTAPNVLSHQLAGKDPNQSLAVDGWVHGPRAYTSNRPPWNSNVWFHLADGSGWVSFAGVRAHPVAQDPTGLSKDGGPPVKLVASCQGSAQ